METGVKSFVYSFIPMGTMVSDSQSDPRYIPCKNKIYMDVGNNLTYGVIDQHHLKNGIEINHIKYSSTAGLISVCPNFILDNIDEDAKTVELVVHMTPDFDCFASVYLAKELITRGSLPEYTKELVEYVEAIDSGKMKPNLQYLETPYMIVNGFEDILKQNPEINSDEEDLNRRILNRGLLLIEHCMNRLKTLKGAYKSLYNPSVMGSEHPFELEMKLIKSDYNKYRADFHNKNICERRQIYLPVINDANEAVKKVDVLIWNREPNCILHKFWARLDPTAALGRGYTATFIPFKSAEFTLNSREKIHTNRVIISVDPNSDVYLKDLGKALEKEEQLKESSIFKEEKGKWRDRSEKKYKEEWCDNANPWYDGCNHNYTIVDSPLGTKGEAYSLLTIEEIKNVFLNFMKQRIKKSFIRHVFYFPFEPKNYKKLLVTFEKSHCVREFTDYEEERKKYFLPYIQEYLYDKKQAAGSYSYVMHYRMICQDQYGLHPGYKSNLFEIKKIPEGIQGNKGSGFISAQMENAQITVFRYGVGLLILDFQLNSSDLYVDDVITFHKSVHNQRKEIFNYYLNQIGGIGGLGLKTKQLYFYSGVELDVDTYYYGKQKEILYRLCNPLFDKNGLVDQIDSEDDFNQMFMEIEKYAEYGFSKEGSALAVVNDLTQMDGREENILRYWNQFKTIDFDIFLLGIYQRNSLMRFAHYLARYSNDSKVKYVRTLRRRFLEFTIQSWFSQITNDEVGMKKYKKWMSVFENNLLYEEVDKQIAVADDYFHGQMSKKMEILSIILLPLVTMGLLFDIQVFQADPIIDNKRAAFYFIISGIYIALWFLPKVHRWIMKE